MAAINPDDGMCHETSGFLFSHPCDRFSIQQCVRCQKPLCEEHGHLTPEGAVCTTCLKQQAQAEKQKGQDTDTRSDSYHSHHYYDSDPYFYGPRYYPGHGRVHPAALRSDTPAATPPTPDMISGGDFSDDDSDRDPEHDPSDFTEGDAGSLQREEDADFESDMGAS